MRCVHRGSPAARPVGGHRDPPVCNLLITGPVEPSLVPQMKGWLGRPGQQNIRRRWIWLVAENTIEPECGGNGIRGKNRALGWSRTRKAACFFQKGPVPSRKALPPGTGAGFRWQARQRPQPAALLLGRPPVIGPCPSQTAGSPPSLGRKTALHAPAVPHTLGNRSRHPHAWSSIEYSRTFVPGPLPGFLFAETKD